MIRLKDILFEQTISKTKQLALAGIDTKYIKILQSIFIPRSSQISLGQFEETTKKEIGLNFDAFVEKYGRRAVKNRGKLKASLNQLPPSSEPSTKEPPTNDAFNIDIKASFKADSAEAPGATKDIQDELIKYKKAKIAELTKQHPGATVRVGFVNYNIIATTSKVPSTLYRRSGGNKALAKARYDKMYASFAEAGKNAGIPGYIGDPNGEAENISNMELLGPVPESPNWTDVESKKFKKDKNGVRRNEEGEDTTAEYEKLYASHRKAFIQVTVQILVDFPEVKGKEIPGAKNEKYMFSLRPKPSISIKLPPIRFGWPGRGLFSTDVPKPGFCPAFSEKTGKKGRGKKNWGNKTNLGYQ